MTLVATVMAIDDWQLWESLAAAVAGGLLLMRQRDLFCPSPVTDGAVADDDYYYYPRHYRLRSRWWQWQPGIHSDRIDIPVQQQQKRSHRIGGSGRLPAAVL